MEKSPIKTQEDLKLEIEAIRALYFNLKHQFNKLEEENESLRRRNKTLETAYKIFNDFKENGLNWNQSRVVVFQDEFSKLLSEIIG